MWIYTSGRAPGGVAWVYSLRMGGGGGSETIRGTGLSRKTKTIQCYILGAEGGGPYRRLRCSFFPLSLSPSPIPRSYFLLHFHHLIRGGTCPPPPAPGATSLGSPLHERGNVGERQWHLKIQATIVRCVQFYIKIDTLFFALKVSSNTKDSLKLEKSCFKWSLIFYIFTY